MGVPDHLLPHQVTIVRPAIGADSYGNQTYDYAGGATRTTVAGWMQQDRRTEPRSDGREPLDQDWLLVTNHTDVQGRDRVEWSGPTMEVEGPPEPVYTPAGAHHVEATLRVVSG